MVSVKLDMRRLSPHPLYILALLFGFIGLMLARIPPMPLARPAFEAEEPGFDHPDEAIAFRNLQLQDEQGHIPADGYARAAKQIQLMRAAQMWQAAPTASIPRAAWHWLGPGNIGGRVRALVVHPTDPNTLWLGSVSGGIWKTTNGGETWFPLDDFMANLAISTLVIQPGDPNTLYAGTGEGFYNLDKIQGNGIFRTTDGGATWSQLPNTANSDFYFVNRLAISPDGKTILAATVSGLWRSVDAGNTWEQTTFDETLDVKFHPTDSALAIASSWNGQAWYSTDGGLQWRVARNLPTTGDRVEVAYAPSDPTIVYASVDINSGELWKSSDGGHSYSLANTGSSYLQSQGWYDNALWVDPTNANVVLVGGVILKRSTDGGVTLTSINSGIHPDHHIIVAASNFDSALNPRVYFGNDGGIYKADNVYTVGDTSAWQELNNQLGITQFYGAAGNVNSGVMVGGTQDNGTLRYAGNTEDWAMMFGGDGGYAAADPTDPNYFYGEYIRLQLHRSQDGGQSSDFIFIGISDAGTNANFIAPFILDPNNPKTLLAGGSSLWRSTDVKAVTPSWSAIKAPLLSGSCRSSDTCISAIAVAPGNPDEIWVGHNNGEIYVTTNGTVISPTWTQISSQLLPRRMVTRIVVDPKTPATVYVTFGGFAADNVWRTTDHGQTWSDLTGTGASGLPDVPVRSLAIYPDNSQWLFVGTETGIFSSEDGGVTWRVPHDGPANVSVDELFWLDSQQLVAATHGRGLYKINLGTALAVVRQSYAEVSGNRNGFIDPGETISLTIDLTNEGTRAATVLTSTLELVRGALTMFTANSSYPDLVNSAQAGNTTPYMFKVDTAEACGAQLEWQHRVFFNLNETFTHTVKLNVGQWVTETATTFTYAGDAVLIPDNYSEGVLLDLPINQTGSIGDLEVMVNVEHTYAGDLILQLIAPNGYTVTLTQNRGGDGDNYSGTTFDDDAPLPIANGSAPFAGRFRPETPLAALLGQPLQGLWHLKAIDTAQLDTGKVLGFAVQIVPQNFVCQDASTPTPTATAATPTATPTPTLTPTATKSPTPTPTETGTPTPTPTATPSPSATPDNVPTVTTTPIIVDTPTETPTPTPTPTLETPVDTVTPIQLETPTDTPTPTDGPSPTPTETPTPSPTDEPSATPTETLTPTPSETATEGASPTPTETPTPTATATDDPSPTPVILETDTPTVTATHTPQLHQIYLPLLLNLP